MTKTRVITYAVSFLLAITLILALAVLFAPRLGWQIDNVRSGSMSPALGVGSAIMTQPVSPSTIEMGDIITYRSPIDGKLTTHRVMDINAGDTLYFQTKGDANEDVDPYLVAATDIVGKVVFAVPQLGHVAGFVKTPLGFGLMLGLPGLMIICLELRVIWIELDKEEKRKKAKGYQAFPEPAVAVEGKE